MPLGTHWSHDLLQKMGETNCSSDDLNDLKELFATEIGQIANIESMDELIETLDRTDIKLGEGSMRANPELQAELIDSSSSPVKPCEELRLAEELERQLHISPPANQNYVTFAHYTEQKRTAVFKKLTEELGRSWRSLGRHIDVREGAMDEIERRFPRNNKLCALRLLQLFEENECHDPQQRLLILCHALSECGRKDLRGKVESILSH